MTLSGHSLDYGVQKVSVPKTSDFPTPAQPPLLVQLHEIDSINHHS